MPNATDMPNYRYGVRGVKLAMQTATGTYGTPWVENGAESIEESRAERSATTFHSDDGKAATVNGAAGNDTMTVKFAEFSDDYNTDILGHHKDTTTGAIVKSPDDEAGIFAIGWEVQGTKYKTRIWRLGCTSSEPVAAAYETKGENVNESAQSCTITSAGDVISNKTVTELVCHEGDDGFATFLDAVPTALTYATN